jgi:hypothetical protein
MFNAKSGSAFPDCCFDFKRVKNTLKSAAAADTTLSDF